MLMTPTELIKPAEPLICISLREYNRVSHGMFETADGEPHHSAVSTDLPTCEGSKSQLAFPSPPKTIFSYRSLHLNKAGEF